MSVFFAVEIVRSQVVNAQVPPNGFLEETKCQFVNELLGLGRKGGVGEANFEILVK